MEERLSKIEREQHRLRFDINQKFEQILDRTGALETRMAALETQVGARMTAFEAMFTARMTAFENTLFPIIRRIEDRVDRHDRRITRLEDPED